MSTDRDLLDEIVAEVARVEGVVVKRNDPIVATVLLNKAILQRYMAQMEQAFAKAVERAQQDLAEHAQEQAMYVEQTMLKDREKFVAEQKAALEALDTSLRKRDAGIVKIMADILEKARATLADEAKKAIEKKTGQRRSKEQKRATLGALAIAVAIGAMGMMGTLIILLRLGVVGVVAVGS